MARTKQNTNHSKELADQGWERRFTVDQLRAGEMRQLYESMGFEVLVEPGRPEEDQECRECFTQEDVQSRYKTIFTRRPSPDNTSHSEEPLE